MLTHVSVYRMGIIMDAFAPIFSCSDTHGGFIHLRVICQAGGYVLGQYSHLFETVPECIAFYCQEKLNIKGARQETLMNPVSRMQ